MMATKSSKRHRSEFQPVDSLQSLRKRVDRFFHLARPEVSQSQYVMHFETPKEKYSARPDGTSAVAEFLDLLCAFSPESELYLFGGMLRDLALLGKKGFRSDIDVVVDGEWAASEKWLRRMNATRNKFGGYRLLIGAWSVDVWKASETWAFTQKLMDFKSIASLTKTTVLNWDAILMNWRTKAFLCEPSYIETLQARLLDVVLQENPNPIGMAVRVLRHLCSKDAAAITGRAGQYLISCTRKFTLETLLDYEFKSYGSNLIEPATFRWLELLGREEGVALSARSRKAVERCEREGVSLSKIQLNLNI